MAAETGISVCDSGAEVSVGNTALLNALLERSPSYNRPETAQLGGVTGGFVALGA